MNTYYRHQCTACKDWCIFTWEPRAGNLDLLFTICTYCKHETAEPLTVQQMLKQMQARDAVVHSFSAVFPQLNKLKKPGDHVTLALAVK
jgi:hypothetical protein